MTKEIVLKTENLTKDYGNNKGAFDINLELKKGEIVGFLGPNGAGKTTTIKMLLGLTKADSGKLSLFGEEISSESARLNHISKIGFLPGDPSFYTGQKVSTIINYLFDLTESKNRKYLNELIQKFELDISKKYKSLSLGNKKKVAIIAAFMNNPELLILDEPTNSLDPLIQSRVLEEVKRVKRDGGTVFFSSHVLSEVEKIADRIILIKNGKLVDSNTKELLDRDIQRKIRVIVHDQKVDLIKMFTKENVIKTENNEYIILASDYVKVIKTLIDKNLTDFYIEKPSLEDIFMKFYQNE